MEALVFLVGALLGLALLAAPLLSLVGLVRSIRMRRDLDALRASISALEQRLDELGRGPFPQHQPPPAVSPASRQTAPDLAASLPTGPGVPRATEAAASSAPVGPQATPPGPLFTAPPPAVPAAPPPPVSASRAAPPPARSTETAAPLPPPLPPSGPPPKGAGSWDWESLAGIRGAAWLGGVALVLAAALFARWSVEQGYVTPTLRLILLVLSGLTALGWAEANRVRYPTTANAASGAGIVTLYLAFYAGHTLYGLLPTGITFVLMSLVTATAAATAIRYDAKYTAILGLVGGLATPVLISTGIDRPLALFSYLFALNAGYLYVSRRQQWRALAVLALAGTALLELGWMAARIGSGNVLVGAAGFAAIGALYVWLTVDTADDEELRAVRQVGLVGGVVPAGLAVLMAADPGLERAWATVLVNVALVAVALTAVGFRRAVPWFVNASAVAAGVAFAAWAGHASTSSPFWGPALLAVGLFATLEFVNRNAPVGLVPFASLLAFTVGLLEQSTLTLPAFLTLMGAAFALFVVRAPAERVPTAVPLSGIAMAYVVQRWFWVVATPETYLGHLVLPHLMAVMLATVAAWRRSVDRQARAWWDAHDTGVTGATALAVVTLFGCALTSSFNRPEPLFMLLALDLVLLLLVVVHTSWSALVGVSAATAVAYAYVWRAANADATLASPVVWFEVGFYLAFVALPFGMLSLGYASWRLAFTPWLSAALIGPALFWSFYSTWVDTWGKAWVGLLPLLLAATTVAALWGVSRSFAADSDEVDPKRRLSLLALFAAIALGFVATAIPLQLDRQWITIGWALEAAAVWWLFARLPHPGLKYFGLALFGAVGVRLLANPEVVRYEPRGQPLVNWLLYTYGVPALCCFAGASWLRRAERRRGETPVFDVLGGDRRVMAPFVGFLGVLLVFWLINLEIADYFSVGRYIEVDFSRQLERDLTRSFAWGLYALVLLGVGIWRQVRGLRVVSLGFLLLTVGKVFLYDLAQLTGLYRVASFLALGLSLMLVSLLYQRFVRTAEGRS